MQYKTTTKISQKVIKEILEVKEKNGLTAEAIIEQAKKKNNPLHDFFDWDDTKAAHKWRLQQARVLINEVKVVVENKEYYAFENVSIEIEADSEEGTTKKEYFTRSEILNDKEKRAQIVNRAYNYLLYWKEQYQTYTEFEPIVKSIEKVKKSMEEKEKKESKEKKHIKSENDSTVKVEA